MSGLGTRRDPSGGTYPWEVIVLDGQHAGERVGGRHGRKRDAQDWIDEHGHLPWEQVLQIEEVTDDAPLLVVVPRESLMALRREAYDEGRKRKIRDSALLHWDGARQAVAAAEERYHDPHDRGRP